MKPILLRSNSPKMLNATVKEMKNHLKKRGSIEDVATIDVVESSIDTDIQVLDQFIIMNDFLILKNINAFELFKNDRPFYVDHTFKGKLISCTVVDSYPEPIFPKGFSTINIDPICQYVNTTDQFLLSKKYGLLSYLKLSLALLDKKRQYFDHDGRLYITNYIHQEIKRLDRELHSLLSRHKVRNETFTSAI